MLLETPRLVLRRWRDSDLAPYATMNADARVMEYFPRPLTTEESAQHIARLEHHFVENDFGILAAELRATGEFIGFVGIQRVPFETHFTPAVEIGWRIAYPHWNQGYATEGAREVLRDAFSRLQLPEVVSLTTTSNLRSRRVMEKLGMTRDPKDDFANPRVEEGHWLRPHVAYRVQKPQ